MSDSKNRTVLSERPTVPEVRAWIDERMEEFLSMSKRKGKKRAPKDKMIKSAPVTKGA